MRALISRSALARYLVVNLQALRGQPRTPSEAGGAAPAGPAFIGNTWSAATPERLRTTEAAVHTFFDELRARTRWPSERVVFVVDGFRVQVFSSDDRSAAERVRGEAEAWSRGQGGAAAGLRGEVAYLEPYYRVRLGPYGLRAVALARAELVNRLGYPAVIVEEKP